LTDRMRQKQNSLIRRTPHAITNQSTSTSLSNEAPRSPSP
jgi:hypothetical protein